jgi:hypothetical protein
VSSVERVADGSLSLHDYAFSPAALDAITLQRVSAALDLIRSRRTLYSSTSSSSWGRSCTASLRDARQLALQLMTAAAFASVMLLAVGRWALVPTWLLFLCSETVRRVVISPPLLPRPFALMSEWLSIGRQCQRTARRRLLPRLQHVRPVTVSAAWTVGCVGAFTGLRSEPE